MAEVRPLESHSATFQGNQVGLFATKDYQLGDAISMDSCPLIQLSTKCLGTLFHKDWIIEMMTTTYDSAALGDVPSKMMAMVEVAFCFVLKQSNEPLENWETQLDIVELRQLYRPSTTQFEQPTTPDGETTLIELSQRAERYVKEKLVTFVSTTNEKNDDLFRNDRIQLRKFIKNELLLSSTATTEPAASHGSSDDVSSTKLHPIIQEIMLIWACNAFDGGIIYKTFSRINHSCDPNSVVIVIDQENQNRNQILKAALPISTGDEICISYLHGPFLYADRSTRQKLLLQDKYFACTCSRCETTSHDSPSAIPCMQCYPREYSRAASTFTANEDDDDTAAATGQSRKVLLGEDVQYDDDHNVHYQYPDFKIVPSLSNIHGPEFACPMATTDAHCQVTEPKPARVRYYHQVHSTARAIVDKVVAFLRLARPDQYHVPPDQTSSNTDNNTQEEFEEEQAIYYEQLEQLLRMSSCILGAMHWTTNILLLYQLNHTLSTFHTRSILKLTSSRGNADNDDDDDDDTESTIAEAIDMLQRIERFVNGVTLVRLHMGHLLSDVIIGVARALVSLGDVKSQTYAAQWIGKIVHYVHHFESPGSQAVVQSLQTAWQRPDDSTAGPPPDHAAKRLKR